MTIYLDRVAVVTREDGGISITRFALNDMQKYGYTDEDEFIRWYMNRIFPGMKFSVISESEIPKDKDGKWDKSQREHWSFKKDKIFIDQEKITKKEEEKNRKTAVLEKLKITEEEAKLLKEI